MVRLPESVKNSNTNRASDKTPVKELKQYDRQFRSRGFFHLAGVDEAGRGPIAGPVVAAAVILPEDFELQGIEDSKNVREPLREQLFQEIISGALSVGISYKTSDFIDSTNILKATLIAMTEAVRNLTVEPDLVLIDGTSMLPLLKGKRQLPIVKGDGKSLSIAAASIVAKVFRDRLMRRYDYLYPEYGFKKHKGYPTREHIRALHLFGPSPIHRKTYKSVRICLEEAGAGKQKI